MAPRFDRQRVFRWLLKTRLFTGFYGRVIGPASALMFTEPLDSGLLRHLPKGARVLEVGCGPGLQAIEIVRRRPDLRLVASDFSREFVLLGERNARRALNAPTPIEFTVADAMDLSTFADASFDAVYSVTAIKHFPDPLRGLTECLRVLKPGGRLLVAEIRRESELAEVQSLAASFRVPSWLRPLAARIVHGSLREECPSMERVSGWFAQLSGRGLGLELNVLTGRPAWLATLSKPA